MFHYSVVLNAIQLYNKYKSYNKVALEISKIKKYQDKPFQSGIKNTKIYLIF